MMPTTATIAKTVSALPGPKCTSRYASRDGAMIPLMRPRPCVSAIPEPRASVGNTSGLSAILVPQPGPRNMFHDRAITATAIGRLVTGPEDRKADAGADVAGDADRTTPDDVDQVRADQALEELQSVKQQQDAEERIRLQMEDLPQEDEADDRRAVVLEVVGDVDDEQAHPGPAKRLERDEIFDHDFCGGAFTFGTFFDDLEEA